jgi:hypothetical protein
MSDERYTEAAFLAAIGKPNLADGWPHNDGPIKGLFHEWGTSVTDSYALGLALEWLRGNSDQVERAVYGALLRTMLSEGVNPEFYGAWGWLCLVCPRPGAALAKAIIDAEGQ